MCRANVAGLQLIPDSTVYCFTLPSVFFFCTVMLLLVMRNDKRINKEHSTHKLNESKVISLTVSYSHGLGLRAEHRVICNMVL